MREQVDRLWSLTNQHEEHDSTEQQQVNAEDITAEAKADDQSYHERTYEGRGCS